MRTEDGKALADVARAACAPARSARAGGGPRAGGNTTIAVVATNARLTKAEISRVALMADDGLARAINPSHTTGDGDTVFALATGRWTGETNVVDHRRARRRRRWPKRSCARCPRAEPLGGLPSARVARHASAARQIDTA